jgi:ubiquitin C-terminal hydrolase
LKGEDPLLIDQHQHQHRHRRHVVQVMAPSQTPGGTIIERQLVAWAAGITAAAAIGYVVLGNYFPTFGWSRKIDKDVVPGLYNHYGNDCFANCVVQVHA